MSKKLKQDSGWLNIYKMRGISSAKAVALVKKSFKGLKVGHSGTLDVEAEGVLPIAIGKATKLIDFLINARKEYIFKVQLGAKTDTGDSAGIIIDKVDKKFPNIDEIKNACQNFIGEISQIPPKYSALKIDGQRAYSLARAGQDFEMKARKVHVYALDLVNYDEILGQYTLKVECSKGTYVRTLAEDVSFSLQNLGYVLELRRTRVGNFSNIDSIAIDNFIDGDWSEAREVFYDNIMNLECVLGDIPVIKINAEQALEIVQGKKIFLKSTCLENIDLSGSLENVIFQMKCRFAQDDLLVAIGTIKHDYQRDAGVSGINLVENEDMIFEFVSKRVFLNMESFL